MHYLFTLPWEWSHDDAERSAFNINTRLIMNFYFKRLFSDWMSLRKTVILSAYCVTFVIFVSSISMPFISFVILLAYLYPGFLSNKPSSFLMKLYVFSCGCFSPNLESIYYSFPQIHTIALCFGLLFLGLFWQLLLQVCISHSLFQLLPLR